MSLGSYVYFIKPVELPGPIKIGCSALPEQRLYSLATWSPFPLEIIVTIPGRQCLEKNIHECFADLHLHREWFKAAARLTNAIDRLKAGDPVERAIDLNNRVGSIRTGRCGGAAWSAQTRQKMSVLHRVRFALKRIGINNYRCMPAAICDVVDASEKRMLTAEERDRLDAFVLNPARFKDECLASYQEWKARYDEVVARRHVSAPNPKEAA